MVGGCEGLASLSLAFCWAAMMTMTEPELCMLSLDGGRVRHCLSASCQQIHNGPAACMCTCTVQTPPACQLIRHEPAPQDLMP